MGRIYMSDADGNQLLNMSELSAFMELMEGGHDDDHDDHDDHDEHDGPVGYATIHIEEEGDYGFALPMGVEFFILMGEGGHDDHGDTTTTGTNLRWFATTLALTQSIHPIKTRRIARGLD